MNKSLAITICSLLIACTPQPAQVQKCAPVKQWTREQQDQILATEKNLSSDSILIPVLLDYSRMREFEKACS